MGLKPKKTKIADVVPVVSHQLKTPILAIKWCLESLLAGDQGKISAGQKEYLSDALKNIEKIYCFIDNFFDVLKIETKNFEITVKPVALEKVIDKVLNELSDWIKANNCKVSFKKSEKLAKALADPFEIHRVVQRIIANAVIYRKGKGDIEITLKQEKGKVLFSCKDNGIGIPKKDFKKVFTKFYRSEEAIILDSSGAGLSLFISRTVIKLSNGKIWFKSKENKGTTFYFTLPIK